jgi:putative flippase GtrA
MKLGLRDIFVHKTQNSYVQFLRYGFVSVVALVVDFGGLIILKEAAGLNYLVAATISFLLGLVVNYLLSALWVFHSSKLLNKKHEIILFSLIGLVGLALTGLILWVLTSKFKVYYILSKAVATFIVYFWNFGARKKYVFH